LRYVAAYDIADDHRREDVATLLSGYGPRVQLSVFECDLKTRAEAAALQSKIRDIIDPVEDQVRFCPLDERAARQATIIGARMIEERQDFWIVT
jgi:CRISPR-associated protein Cas2